MPNSTKHIHEVAQPVLVAEVYIFRGDSLLMVKRSETKKKFPGFWSIPGGHIDEGEDALAAAVREVKEETGVTIQPKDIKLKVVAFHHHLDRGETYISFGFVVTLQGKPQELISSDEGEAYWVDKREVLTKDNLFPPVKYYLNRVIRNEPGIIYNYSQWRDSQLVQVMSETVDKDA